MLNTILKLISVYNLIRNFVVSSDPADILEVRVSSELQTIFVLVDSPVPLIKAINISSSTVTTIGEFTDDPSLQWFTRDSRFLIHQNDIYYSKGTELYKISYSPDSASDYEIGKVINETTYHKTCSMYSRSKTSDLMS